MTNLELLVQRLAVFQHFANYYSIHAQATFSAPRNYGGVGEAFFELEEFVVLLDKVVFNWVHHVVDSLEHCVVPSRRQPEKLPEVFHVVL